MPVCLIGQSHSPRNNERQPDGLLPESAEHQMLPAVVGELTARVRPRSTFVEQARKRRPHTDTSGTSLGRNGFPRRSACRRKYVGGGRRHQRAGRRGCEEVRLARGFLSPAAELLVVRRRSAPEGQSPRFGNEEAEASVASPGLAQGDKNGSFREYRAERVRIIGDG